MMKTFAAYLAELVGTLLLVLLGCGSAVLAGPHIGFVGISFAFGLTLVVLAYSLGSVSGCHLNPAVTTALALVGKFSKLHVVPYFIMQLIGAALGAYILCYIAKGMPGFDITKGFALNGFDGLSPFHYSMMAVGCVESIVTGFLVFAVLTTTTKGFPVGFGPLLVGVALLVGNLIAIPVSNASINFARTFGPALVAANEMAIQQLPYFLLFNIIGAGLGALLHILLQRD